MSLSTFGGEINRHCNFDLDVCGLWNAPAKKNKLKGACLPCTTTTTTNLMVPLVGYHQTG
jgi:hypothetical protein